MNYYDHIIETVLTTVGKEEGRIFSSNPALAWPEISAHTLIMEKECALELGREPKTSVEFTACTESHLIWQDEVRVIGPELSEIIDQDGYFGKIVLLGVSGLEDEKLYDQIKEIEYIKFKLYLDGYMTRASVEKHCENVRISKRAMSSGISLEKIGNAIINRYKEHPLVEHVQVIFITKKIDDFHILKKQAAEVREITNAMCTIMDDLNFDCGTCNIKPICDEVGGLMELHKKQAG